MNFTRSKCRSNASLILAAILPVLALSLMPAVASAACANEEFRTGASAQLPDCRAYELVTPPSSNGRVLRERVGVAMADLFPLELFSSSNGGFIFETNNSSLKEPVVGSGRDYGDVWEAERGTAGWKVVRLMAPPPPEATSTVAGGVSSDHRYNFVFVYRYIQGLPDNGTLAADGDAGYLHDSSGGFELTGIGSLGVERLVTGRYISPGGDHILFSTGKKGEESSWCALYETSSGGKKCAVARLEPDAPPAGTGAVYDRSADGPTHVVSLLPGNVTPSAGENAVYEGTSVDASSVAFTIGDTLFVRVGNGTSAAKTEEVASGDVIFGGLSEDGTYLFYVSAGPFVSHGDIHRLNTETGLDEVVNATGDAELVHVSQDGSHVYFVSPSLLDGAEGTAGKPNLYVASGQTPNFIATVSESDISNKNFGLTAWPTAVGPPTNAGVNGPGNATSRTTPSGDVIVFESRAQLTPFDNAGHVELYRYDNADESLLCVSCNPAGGPATADSKLQNIGNFNLSTDIVVNNLNVDGSQVVFETAEALLPGDQNDINDVYEWQQNPLGPTLALISTGRSNDFVPNDGLNPNLGPNVLLDVSKDGKDVFFRSLEPLVAGAPEGGAPAIYDARVDGGFPAPSVPGTCFDAGTCRPETSPAPSLAGPGSPALGRSKNVKARHHRRCKRRANTRSAKHKRHCPRGKKGRRGTDR